MTFVLKLLSGTLLMFVLSNRIYCQDADVVKRDKVIDFPVELLNKVTRKQSEINRAFEKQTVKYLNQLSRRERRLERKLVRGDSIKATELFHGTQAKYHLLAQEIQHPSATSADLLPATYIPYFDSLKTALRFLYNTAFGGTDPTLTGKLQSSLSDLNQLQHRLNQSEEINAFVAQRQEEIKLALSHYSSLPTRLRNSYAGLSRDIYYYQVQLKAYKDLINDPSKIEQKALTLLNRLPAFQAFMQKNSLLASLFPIPDNYKTPDALACLQTRAQVQELISSRMAGGQDLQSAVQTNLQDARAQLSKLKNKASELVEGNSSISIPEFTPDKQKTKTFLKRLEYGTSVQTIKSNDFFPTTTDIGLHVGYKINDKSVAGIGCSYKLGLGKDFRHMAFSHEGMGIRSYVEYKLKKSFWLSGGAEINYRNRFSSFEVLKKYSSWQQSILIGLCNKYQVSRKVSGNVQILYDALWKKQIPRAQPLVFRIGYSFK